MRKELCDIFDGNRYNLARGLDVEHGLLNKLVSNKVITDDHLEDIQSMRTTRQKSETLLDILKKLDDQYYDIFRGLVAETQAQLAHDCLPSVPCQESSWNNKI